MYLRKSKRKTKEKLATQAKLVLVMAFHKSLTGTKNVIDKYWHIVSIRHILDKKPFIPYRRNKNLHQITGGNCTLKSKVVHKNKENHKQSGKCSPYFSRLNNFCCKQAKRTKILKRYRTNQIFKSF